MTENGRTFAPRGPVEVGQFLDVKAQELDQLLVLLQSAHEVQGAAEEAWTEHYDEILEQLQEEAQAAHERLPGEEVRLSIARRRGGAEKWTNLRRADRAVRRMEKEATQKANVISACQSEAKLLRATS